MLIPKGPDKKHAFKFIDNFLDYFSAKTVVHLKVVEKD